MAVAAVGERGEGAVFECEQSRIGTFSGARLYPTNAGCRAHALDAAAADQAYNVDLVRCPG